MHICPYYSALRSLPALTHASSKTFTHSHLLEVASIDSHFEPGRVEYRMPRKKSNSITDTGP